MQSTASTRPLLALPTPKTPPDQNFALISMERFVFLFIAMDKSILQFEIKFWPKQCDRLFEPKHYSSQKKKKIILSEPSFFVFLRALSSRACVASRQNCGSRTNFFRRRIPRSPRNTSGSFCPPPVNVNKMSAKRKCSMKNYRNEAK